MRHLYEIADSLRAIDRILEEQGGEITDEQAAQLEADQTEFHNRTASIARLIQLHKLDLEVVKSELKRLGAIKKTTENQIRSWEDYVMRSMEQANVDSVDDATIGVTRAKNSQRSIEWKGEDHQIPPFCVRITQEYSLNKAAALEAWDQGMLDDVADNIEIKQGYHLRIR